MNATSPLNSDQQKNPPQSSYGSKLKLDLDNNGDKLTRTVFLRQLEYFKGVMFLTTNRMSTLDAALKSRIHLTINYPTLAFDSRRHIWHAFVTAGDNSDMSNAGLMGLAELQMNGRQIKNVVKTARLLAKQRKQLLRIEGVDLVLQVKMKAELKSVGGDSADDRVQVELSVVSLGIGLSRYVRLL